MSFQCVVRCCCSAVKVCLCGFLRCLGLRQKIDSNITLLPQPLQNPRTHKNTHICKPCHPPLFGIGGVSMLFNTLTSCLRLLFCLCIICDLCPPALCSLSLFPSFRVMWPLARGNQAGTSTTPWCCTTTTAPAGLSRSSCPSPSTCFGGRTSDLSSDTAPVSSGGAVAE